MIYPYRCPGAHEFEVYKPIADIAREEKCPQCGEVAVRYIARTHFYGAKVEDAEWNPAFGQVVKNTKHRKQLAKEKGMEEIGNEPVENVHKHFEKQKERELEQSWDKV